jgi:hypothetical protein
VLSRCLGRPYLGALTGFDRFLDFSIPSEITVSTANVFDGLH